jgi:superfamily II DNA/RNA helicase
MNRKKEITENTIKNLKFESLNVIQETMVNTDDKVANILLLSPTGSGKTVAFLLPLLYQLDEKAVGTQALILVPSRELALQIEQVFRLMSTGFKVNCCYGGHPFKTERNNFSEPPVVLIGTPGRIAAHIRRGSFNPETIHTLVLDEFDKSLEMGFSDEMSFIINQLKNVKKRILTSATQAVELPKFTGIKDPLIHNFLTEENRPNILMKALRAKEKDKLDVLIRLVCTIGNEPTLVFCNHREAVDRIDELLSAEGIVHEIFHGGLEQDERERALLKFRNGSHQILITTDLASRGLDIPEIMHVVHYQGATTEEVFIHRNGRTARMNTEGKSWIILSEKESLPHYLNLAPEFVELPEIIKLPNAPFWITLYIGAGKKDKISKTDIVGFLIQKGNLVKEDIGLITLLDNASFVAINREKARQTIATIKDEKVKNKKVKIAISN